MVNSITKPNNSSEIKKKTEFIQKASGFILEAFDLICPKNCRDKAEGMNDSFEWRIRQQATGWHIAK